MLDLHASTGEIGRQQITGEQLLDAMDAAEVTQAIVAPGDAEVAVQNRQAIERLAALVDQFPRRFVGFHVPINPWHGRAATELLRVGIDAGARFLYLDPARQGFDLLGSILDPLLDLAERAPLPVFVQCGTPPWALPLQVSELARRWSGLSFVIGRSGMTDFVRDIPTALSMASNVFADSAHLLADLGLQTLSDRFPKQVVSSSNWPYGDLATAILQLNQLTETARSNIHANSQRLLRGPSAGD